MQSVRSRIWTRVAVSISSDDNHYTTGTSLFYIRLCDWTTLPTTSASAHSVLCIFGVICCTCIFCCTAMLDPTLLHSADACYNAHRPRDAGVTRRKENKKSTQRLRNRTCSQIGDVTLWPFSSFVPNSLGVAQILTCHCNVWSLKINFFHLSCSIRLSGH